MAKNALGKGGAIGLVKPQGKAVSGRVDVEVLPPASHLDDLYAQALDRVYAIPLAKQTPEMRELLASVFDRLDELACIGKYQGQKPPRNASVIHNALKTRVILTFGPQIQRTQKASVEESHQEITVRYIHPTQAPEGAH